MSNFSFMPADGYAGDITVEEAHRAWRAGEAVLVDIRSDAERAWVGFVPDAEVAAWKQWPAMTINERFDDEIRAIAAKRSGKALLMLCRSGIRSIPSSKRATELGFVAFNVLEGFEGDPDANAHRNTTGGWRARGLPWKQN
jgi:sulfur dioxygenase